MNHDIGLASQATSGDSKKLLVLVNKLGPTIPYHHVAIYNICSLDLLAVFQFLPFMLSPVTVVQEVCRFFGR